MQGKSQQELETKRERETKRTKLIVGGGRSRLTRARSRSGTTLRKREKKCRYLKESTCNLRLYFGTQDNHLELEHARLRTQELEEHDRICGRTSANATRSRTQTDEHLCCKFFSRFENAPLLILQPQTDDACLLLIDIVGLLVDRKCYLSSRDRSLTPKSVIDVHAEKTAH